MTKKVFWVDPYLTQLETSVRGVDGNKITVNETIFYAFSGGQESDHGSIGGYPVLEAKKEGKEIIYTLPENHDLKIGQKTNMMIDWARRYALMRLHFAAELVLELVSRRFPGINKIGAHIGQEKARIDFQIEEPISTPSPVIAERSPNYYRLKSANYQRLQR